MAASNREKFAFKNTLICLLKALEGQVAIVELRNETSVKGRITNVDGWMNMTMTGGTFKNKTRKIIKFTDFFVQGFMIRFVQIPDHIDIRKAIESEVYADVRHKAKSSAIRKQTNEKRMERRKKFQEKEDKRLKSLEAKSRLSMPQKEVPESETQSAPLREYPDIL